VSPGALVEVAVALPLPGTYHYRLPPEFEGSLRPGQRVLVPFGPRRITGYVLGFPHASPVDEAKLRPVADVLDPEPLLGEELLGLVRQAWTYYAAAPGEMLRAALPAGLNVAVERKVRLPGAGDPEPRPLPAGARAARLTELLRLVAPEPRPCAGLLRAAGRAARMAHLLELAALGQVVLEEELSRPRVRGRSDLLLRPGKEPASPGRLGAQQIRILQWVQDRGELLLSELRTLHPQPHASLRSLLERGLLRSEPVEALRDPFLRDPVEPDQAPTPSPAQARALERLGRALGERRFAPVLLHGETGSGKTEVYLEVIRRARAEGGTALVMVPEISLTPQLAGRFRARFGDDAVAVLHSGLSDGERYDQWRRIRAGRAPIVVGARSAVFAPLERPRVFVVDEEHDPSYHQTESPRYDGRNLALLRAQACGALILLGSATPSLESYAQAQRGRYELVELKGRPGGARLPEVELVDLRSSDAKGPAQPFSEPLRTALQATLAAGEQSILFLNRRGYAPSVLCPTCGASLSCEDCSVSLTFHRTDRSLRCHYCDRSQSVPDACPVCGARRFTLMGLGTEKVEAAVRSLLPGARVARLDRDTVGRQGGLEDLLRSVREREVDVLVGTQMVTKGHDFPGVTLVGVLLADQGLRVPDFRAGERSFQLLTQVAGRAGRAERPGRVIVQAYDPGHHAVACAQAQDYAAFLAAEVPLRQRAGFPPFAHLVALHLDGSDAQRTEEGARRLGEELSARLLAPGAPRVTLLGPARAPLEQLRGRYRWQLLLRSKQRAAVRSLLPLLLQLAQQAQAAGLRAAVDVDPISML